MKLDKNEIMALFFKTKDKSIKTKVMYYLN
jgi:hypothetical protein